MNINTISRIIGKLLLIMILLLPQLPFQLTYAHDYSSSSDNHEVAAITEYPEKQEESGKKESEEVSNRATEYRLELVASPPAGGNPGRTDSGSSVVWLPVGGNLGNMRAFPNPGYRFLHWEVVSGPIFIFDSNSEDLSVNQREAGNSVIRAVFEPVQGGNITVKHEDEAGNQLADPSVLTGLVDQTYTTAALSISGWQLSKTPENASGTFRVEEQTVVYTYEPEQNLWGTVPWSYEEGTKTITLYGGEAGEVADAPWKTYSSVKQIIVEDQVILPKNSESLFSNLQNLEVIENTDRLNVSNVENMRWMFSSTSNLRELDLRNWDTSNVINMNSMFSFASSLTELDLNNWNISNVTDISYMFNGASLLKTLHVRNWNTSNVTTMSSMFQNANSLIELDISNWNTSKVTSTSFMFQSANSITELDLGNWNTSALFSTMFMFNGANSLTKLDISNWNTASLSLVVAMFNNTSLKTIVLGEKTVFPPTSSAGSTNLPQIEITDQYTGRWVLEESLTSGTGVIAFENSTEFMNNYDGTYPGTYIWEPVPPEQLIAKFDPVSDQSVAIHGHATESVDHLTITYKNTEGSTVVLEKDSPRIVWGEYQDTQEKVRSFQINLTENERLETGSTVEIKLSKPSGDTTGDVAEEQTVIKGIDYRSNNFTLDRSKLNELATVEALHALILQESRAQAKNILSEEDMTNDFRIVETDLSLDSEEDGSYYAILEVGNKAYQMTIDIDLTSKVEHLRVTIPVKMIFESLYDEEESNRQFESQTYEIHNQSSVAIDTYINQVAIDDSAGIVLLKKGEDPLDYAESAVEDPSYEDITKPLLRLHLQTQETKKQLYATMSEQHLIRLSEGDRTPLSLSGEFYGNYPRWIDHPELEQGGYYESTLVPNYRIVLRFVPRI